MAQVFYVTQKILKHSKMYGYNVVEARVFKILEDDAPSLVHAFEYQTGATPGICNLVMRELVQNGILNSKYAGKDYYEMPRDEIKIFEML